MVGAEKFQQRLKYGNLQKANLLTKRALFLDNILITQTNTAAINAHSEVFVHIGMLSYYYSYNFYPTYNVKRVAILLDMPLLIYARF